MDAFAVSICKGLSMQKLSVKNAAIVGCYFGGFQALMPAIVFMRGDQVREVISARDHWFAFVLLSISGIGMIRDARSDEEEDVDSSVGFKSMFPLAVATSIDALAVGVTFAFPVSYTPLPASPASSRGPCCPRCPGDKISGQMHWMR